MTGEWAKHPRPFLKKVGNKKLRRYEIEKDSVIFRKKSRYKRFKPQKFCPFCYSNLVAQNLNQKIRHLGECKTCLSIKSTEKCPYCRSDNVWKIDKTYRCKRCGKFFQ